LAVCYSEPAGDAPSLADNVVKYGLKPVLKELGLPTKFAGLHVFRHGLATELADRGAPIPVYSNK